ncbi:MAG: type III secretion system outer membrane ring subunit SctC [Mailhella sp.]|nr:type III secretion system outer membrane ring subunit SctC [Mailhella sp.]
MACALLLVFACSPALAAGLFRTPFSYYADHQDLATVLMNFARSEGYTASLSPEIKGTVSGRFQNVAPDTFLEGMQSAFDVNWYAMGRTLHFYRSSESKTIFLSPRTGSAGQLYSALSQASVFSAQLPPRMSAGGDVITVTGPPAYLEQIRAAAAAYETSQAEQIVMRVFPLKHAWAEDITVSSMDKTVTIPGIAAILRAMVMGTSVSGTQVTQEKATVQKLGGTGLAAQGREQQQMPQTSQTPVSAGSISIMADPRVNAVLVSDAAFRMPYYEKVIRDLDKPVELVEIHAAIVDIDTDFKRDLGITFQGADAKSKGWSVGGTSSGSSTSGTGLPSVAGAISDTGMTLSTIYTHGSDFFLSRIQALEAHDEARVLGRPSVLTVDNIQATLENTTTYYVEVQGYQAVDLYKVEAGTVLRVTPHIIRENGETSIKLAVSVQDDQDSSASSGTSSGVPPIKQTKINTQAVVNAGQSLLIGGYYYEQKDKTESGIPLLMNIPVLGNLFKTTSRQNKRMERLILITPRIISPSDINVPVHAEDPSLHRAASQADYEARIPSRRKAAGCTRSAQEPSASIPSGHISGRGL